MRNLNKDGRISRWLLCLKRCDTDTLMSYYAKCLKYLKAKEKSNCAIGKKDLTYYMFFIREYIESIFSGVDCIEYEEKINNLDALYIDNPEEAKIILCMVDSELNAGEIYE